MRRSAVVAFAVVFAAMLAWTPGAAVATNHLAVGSQHTDFGTGGEAAPQTLTNLTVSGSGDAATVGLSSLGPAPGTIDDFEDGDTNIETSGWSGWAGDMGSFSAQQSTTLEGSWSGELSATGSSEAVRATRDSASSNVTGVSLLLRVSDQTGSDFDKTRVLLGSDSAGFFAGLLFVQDGTIERQGGTDTGQTWSASTTYRIRITNIDYANEQYDAELIRVSDSATIVSETDVSFTASASEFRDIEIRNGNFEGASEVNVFADNITATEPQPAPDSAQYVSAIHNADNGEQAAINLPEMSNVSVDATVRTPGGSTLGSETYTSAGNKSLSLSSTSSSQLETVLNVSATGDNPQFSLADESILFDPAAPSATLQSPADGTGLSSDSVTLEAQVTDADFPTAQGDSVTATIEAQGPNESSFSTVDSTSVSSNGTVSTTFSPATGGTWDWRVQVDDSYGESSTSATRQFSVPDTLYIRHETNASNLVTEEGNVTVRFFGDQEVVTRQTDNGTIRLTGLNVTAPLIVSADVTNFTSRTIYLESLYEQQSLYMLNTTSTQTVESRFTLDDPTGEFGSETLLKILKPIERNGTTAYRIIYADRFGVEGVTAEIEEGARYQIRIEAPDGRTQSIGPYRASAGEVVNVEPGTPQIDLGSLSDSWQYGAAIDNDTITYQYVDPTGDTDQVTVYTYEKGNRSNQLAMNRTYTNPTQVTGSYSLTANQTEKTWVVTFDVDRTGETYVLTDTVQNTPTLTPGFDEKWQLIVGIGALLISAGVFSVVNVGVGAVIIALEGGLLWYLGYLDGATSAAGVTMALFVAILGHFLSSSR